MVESSFPKPFDALPQGVHSPKVDSQRALNCETTLNLSTSSQQDQNQYHPLEEVFEFWCTMGDWMKDATNDLGLSHYSAVAAAWRPKVVCRLPGSLSNQQIGCWVLNAWRGNSELQEPKPLVYLQQAPMVASRQAAWTDD